MKGSLTRSERLNLMRKTIAHIASYGEAGKLAIKLVSSRFIPEGKCDADISNNCLARMDTAVANIESEFMYLEDEADKKSMPEKERAAFYMEAIPVVKFFIR